MGSKEEHFIDIVKSHLVSDSMKLSTECVGGMIDPLVFSFTILILSCFVGYYVVWKVTPSLHTPLMSITNAISGIIILGAIISSSSNTTCLASIFGFVAAFFSAINIFGGFVVTERMLEMFKKK